MPDPFQNHQAQFDSPALNAAAVTPNDAAPIATTPRALYVGGAGDIAVIMKGGGEVVFVAAPAGSILPISPSHIKSSGTTATNILALW